MPKDGHNKDVNCKGLVDAEKIKKSWKEYSEELYKKGPNEPDGCGGMVSHPEPDILRAKSCGP